MIAAKPLNPALYNRLKEEFGTVSISQEGIAANKRYGHGHLISQSRPRMELDYAGEYYRVNCPYCGDSRGRMWVNHLWGVWDEMTNSYNLWLAICFNENCLDYQSRPSELYNKLYGFKNANLRGQQVVILKGTVEDTALKDVALPGLTTPITKLAPTSPAIRYLKERRLNPAELESTFNISYCLNSDNNYALAQDRIVIPVYMNNMLVGWQCRYVGELNWKLSKLPKYYTRPNMPKRLMLYNYDNAIKFPFVVVSEGAVDVWHVGPFGVAIFGKKASTQQVKLLCNNWEVIVILLDGDAHDDADQLSETITRSEYKGKVIVVKLPKDKDPANFDQGTLLNFIIATAEANNINLLELKRSDNVIDNRHIKNTELFDGVERLKKQLAVSRTVSEYSFDMPRNAGSGP